MSATTSIIEGSVSSKTVNVGSKSEHDAVIFSTNNKEYILKRIGGNPFNDDELNKLVGKTIRAIGANRGKDFIMSWWEVVS